MKIAIIGLLLAVYAFEAVVSLLNKRHSRRGIPELLQDVYDEERYQKWLAYSLELHQFSLLRRGFSLLVLLALFLSTFSYLERALAELTPSPLLQTLYFLGIYYGLLAILGLPFSVYQTFSIEERHGFNRTSRGTFIKDKILGLGLTLLLGGLIVAGLHFLYLRYLDNLWVFMGSTWLAVSLIMLLVFTFLNRLFLRLFNKFKPLPAGPLRSRIEELAASVGFNIKAISVMDASKRSTKSNAAFTGLGKTKEVILFDTLLAKMSDDEVMAVLAHELGHAVHQDTLRMLVIQMGVAIFFAAGMGLILGNPAFFTAFGLSGVHFGFSLILFSVLFQPLTILLGIPLNLVMRRREFQADRFAAQHTDGQWLISALKVLSRENLANLNPHPLTVLLYYSHPPMQERVRALL